MKKDVKDYRKAALVYQGGIANVFAVRTFTLLGEGRTAKRLLQADFRACENFARGLEAANFEVKSLGCNEAGDIRLSRWTHQLETLPFSEQFRVVGS